MLGMRIFKQLVLVGVIVLAGLVSSVSPLTIGSDTTPSRQAQPIFPTATDNQILGFARLENGFQFVDNKTSCSYNDFMSIIGTVNMNNGKLWLQQDLRFDNPTYFINGGTIVGNDFAVELPRAVLPETTAIPATSLLVGGISGFTEVANSNYVGAVQVNSMDWNFNNNYIALGSNVSTNQELVIYQFASNTLTVTQTLEEGVNVNSVRWHPTLSYLGVAVNANGVDEFQMYNYNISKASLTLTGSAHYPAKNGTAVAWHPSGQFVVVGGSLVAKEVISYAFNTVTGQVTEKSSFKYPVATSVSNNAMSFAPGGNLLAVGTINAGANNSLEIFSFSGGILTAQTGIVPAGGPNVLAVDWNPTGTYIAIGDSKGPEVNIYAYNQAANTLTLETSLTMGTAANTVAWDNTGQYLAVGYTAATGTDFKVYFFNPIDFTLTELGILPVISNTNTFSSRWSRGNSYLASGDAAGDLTIYVASAQSSNPLYFRDTRLVFNSDVVFNIPIHFSGNCIINGRGNALNFVNNGNVVIRPASTLTLEDVNFRNLGSSNLMCLTDDGVLVVKNSILTLARDYTFSRGSILFTQDVAFSGTNRFVYSTGLTSTIDTDSLLYFGYGTTFSYAPRKASKSLLAMTDPTSILYLDGSSLFSTRTGLQLSVGTLILDDNVTLSSGAHFPAEGISLKSNLTVQVRGGANLNLFGIIRADS